jgi:hypothetical protein
MMGRSAGSVGDRREAGLSGGGRRKALEIWRGEPRAAGGPPARPDAAPCTHLGARDNIHAPHALGHQVCHQHVRAGGVTRALARQRREGVARVRSGVAAGRAGQRAEHIVAAVGRGRRGARHAGSVLCVRGGWFGGLVLAGVCAGRRGGAPRPPRGASSIAMPRRREDGASPRTQAACQPLSTRLKAVPQSPEFPDAAFGALTLRQPVSVQQ